MRIRATTLTATVTHVAYGVAENEEELGASRANGIDLEELARPAHDNPSGVERNRHARQNKGGCGRRRTTQKAMTGSRLSNRTLKLVDTIARCRIR
jgi:hypothetical protein